MIKTKLFILICITTLPFLYMNCSSSDSEQGALPIPNAKSVCLNLQSSQCTTFSSGRSIFVGITDNITVNCAFLLSSQNTNLLHQLFLASSISPASFNTTQAYLGAVHSNWKSSSNFSITTLENKQYLFCAFIDANGDSFLNSGEPLLSQQNLLGDLNHIDLESWGSN